jgi:protein CpxP
MELRLMTLKQTLFASALLLGSSSLALAQGTAPSATTTGNPQNTPTISPSSPAVNNPGVNPSAAGMSPGARGSGSSANPNANSVRSGDAGLERGANSFTEGQARRRIEDHGYTNVGQMHKDQNSIWQAEAMKAGQRVRVGVDFRGNVVEEKR